MDKLRETSNLRSIRERGTGIDWDVLIGQPRPQGPPRFQNGTPF